MNQVAQDLEVAIKAQRLQLDLLFITLENAIERFRGTGEHRGIDEAVTINLYIADRSVKDSFMWLGKAMKFLGVPNPYPNSMDPSNRTVDPDTDRNPSKILFADETDLILWTKAMRQAIDESVQQLRHNLQMLTVDPQFRMYHISAEYAWCKLNDANHCMGLILRSLHEFEKSKAQPGPVEPAADETERDASGDVDASTTTTATTTGNISPIEPAPLTLSKGREADPMIENKIADLPPAPADLPSGPGNEEIADMPPASDLATGPGEIAPAPAPATGPTSDVTDAPAPTPIVDQPKAPEKPAAKAKTKPAAK